MEKAQTADPVSQCFMDNNIFQLKQPDTFKDYLMRFYTSALFKSLGFFLPHLAFALVKHYIVLLQMSALECFSAGDGSPWENAWFYEVTTS